MKEKQLSVNSFLIDKIGALLEDARRRSATAVNTILVETYWLIGKEIVEHELGGNIRAEYGKESLKKLSKELIRLYGKGFSYPNLRRMRQFYYSYNICSTLSSKFDQKFVPGTSVQYNNEVETLSAKSTLSKKMLARLSWSHICLLLAVSDKDARSFYEIEIVKNGWSVREAKRQIESMLFERLALSKDKSGLRKLAKQGQIVESPEDALKDPYVLEFLGLDENEKWLESDLEQALMDHLQKFLLELGAGFMFVARQMRISINNEHYRVDLVFYNKRLKCYVLIDLKSGKFDHSDYGQMKFYLNYFKEELNDPDDNDPAGLILCYEKDDEFAEYVLKDEKNVFAKKYLLSLPDKQKLLAEVQRVKEKFERERE